MIYLINPTKDNLFAAHCFNAYKEHRMNPAEYHLVKYPYQALKVIAQQNHENSTVMFGLTIKLNKLPVTQYPQNLIIYNPFMAQSTKENHTQINNWNITIVSYEQTKTYQTYKLLPSVTEMVLHQVNQAPLINYSNQFREPINVVHELNNLEYLLQLPTRATRFVYLLVTQYVYTNELWTYPGRNGLIMNDDVVRNTSAYLMPKQASYYVIDHYKFLVTDNVPDYWASRLMVKQPVDGLITLDMKLKGKSVARYLLVHHGAHKALQKLLTEFHFTDATTNNSVTGYGLSDVNWSILTKLKSE